MPKTTKPEIKNKVLELLKDPEKTFDDIASITGVSSITVSRIARSYNLSRGAHGSMIVGDVQPIKITPPKFAAELEENGNIIRPTTKGLVPANLLRAKLCQAYFYLKRNPDKAMEAISYCLAQIDEVDK